ncbi:MAG: AzlD domain-containing protein [Rhodocyclaceae bacterium]|nr:AzlD domain-containing protein [Rhodocyclaceae bacterium]
MIEGVWLWVTFALIALATHLPRGSFIVAGSRVRLPATLQRALRYAPAAALSALVMPDVVLEGGELDPLNPKLAAALAVLLIAARWRNPWLPFIAGMGVLLLLRKGLGW